MSEEDIVLSNEESVRIILMDDSFEKGDHYPGLMATSTLYLA
jgi:hypothetical protein